MKKEEKKKDKNEIKSLNKIEATQTIKFGFGNNQFSSIVLNLFSDSGSLCILG